MVAADEVQAKVDSRGGSRGGEYVAAVHVEHVGVDAHTREAFLQQAGVEPMCGCFPPVE
jgi:hypothetical protein